MVDFLDNNNSSSSNGTNRTKKVQLDAELLPVNKHAPTPLEKQRVQVAKLLQNPTREINLPKAPKDKSIRPPREMMKNVQGSSAGAGSGEFHVYKQSRRREYERLRLMDEMEEKEKIKAEFELKQLELKRNSEIKTEKNRLKRQKKKEKTRKKKTTKGPMNDGTRVEEKQGDDGGQSSNSDDDSNNSEQEDNKKKRKKLGAAPIAEGMVYKKPSLLDHDQQDDDLDLKLDPGHLLVDSNLSSSNLDGLISIPVVQSTGLTIVEDN